MNCHVTATLGHVLKYNDLSIIAELATVSDLSFPVHKKLYEFGHISSINCSYKFDVHYTNKN